MKYDLKKEKIAVHCQTLEEAEKVIKQLNGLGFSFPSAETCFQFLGNGFCLENFKGEGIESLSYYEERGYTIIPASEYLSQFEEVPKYGQSVWVRANEDEKWKERIFIDIANNGNCRAVINGNEEDFKNGKSFSVVHWKNYRTTDPAKDRPTLTLQEIADLKGVSIEQAKEMINKLK